MPHPLLFIMGWRTVTAKREDAARLCELCRRRGLVYRGLTFREETVSLRCSIGTAKRLLGEARRMGLSVELGSPKGLPAWIYERRRRYGLVLGLAFCLWLFVWSENTLFSIRVEGNSKLSDEEVIAELSACGLSVGDSLRGVNTSVLENRLLIASEDIAWISVNLRGNVANVVIREREAPPEENQAVASNLVAKRGGIIEWMEEIRGEIVVEVGDAVAPGDLLVSGVYGKEDGPLRLSRASGRVYARTERQFEIHIPLCYEKKEYTGEVLVEKYLIFFEKEVKFFANTGNLPATCDTIERVEHFGLREDRTLPVGIRTVEYAEYRTVWAERSPEAAEELAYYELRLRMESEVPEGMLVRKSLRAELRDDEFVLYCDAEYIEDIGEIKNIEVEGSIAPAERE